MIAVFKQFECEFSSKSLQIHVNGTWKLFKCTIQQAIKYEMSSWRSTDSLEERHFRNILS